MGSEPPRIPLDEVLRRVRDVAVIANECAPEIDAEARWPAESLGALRDAGLGGLVVPEKHGGLGFGLDGLARISEILGAACPSTAICFGMHCVASAVLGAKATPSQRVRYLDPIVAGEHFTTLALSEPGTGSHFWIPETSMASDGDVLAVVGEKSFVTNGGHADSYVLNVTAAEPHQPGEFSVVVIDGDDPGLRWGKRWTGLGMRGNSSRDLEIDARIPAGNLLGETGDEIWYVFGIVAPNFLMAMAGTYIGLAAAALGEAIDSVRKRELSDSGRSVAGFDVTQYRVGELWAQVERTRALIRHACARGDAGDANALPALCAAKAEVADCANEVVGGAMSLMGGVGFRSRGSMERRLRDARAAHVMSPTTELLRLWTGRSLLEQPLLT